MRRGDDEKGPLPQHVVAHNPELGGAVVVGTRRFQAALLIEASAKGEAGGGAPLTTAEQAALIERVWPSVQEANSDAPAHARVEKALRAASVGQYPAEIEALYANAELGPDGDGEPHAPLVASDPESVIRFVQESVSAVTSWPHEDADHHSSGTFFERGMDSLVALQLTRVLRRGLHRPEIGLPTVYRNPTVSQLTSAILAGIEDGPKDDDRAIMDSLLSTYRGIIDQIPQPETPSSKSESHVDEKPTTIILTGSTGTIGTYLLHALLSCPGKEHMICLNRSEHGGLIIHNAWAVNFDLGIDAFRPHLVGLVNLLTLYAASENPSCGGGSFVFISSVSAAGGMSAAPEEVFSSLDVPHHTGYARSKLLDELLCDPAGRRLGVPVTVARVGQVAGAVRRQGGEWNRAEWLPSLVISSLLRLGGCLPGDLGPQVSEVDWLPVDVLSDVLVDIATRRDEPELGPQAEKTAEKSASGGGAEVFNLRNPRTTSWEALLPAIIDTVKTHLHHDYEVVPPSAWPARLRDRESEEDKGTLEEDSSNPAIKLLDFYSQGLWANTGIDGQTAKQRTRPMAIDRALVSSSTLRDVPAVSAEWTRKWVGEWLTAPT
ncbi:hypothetical protein diail_5263 [Diaporthe ilicicola]|nr:hypothetical protein diail_5263 [Diaporthe ilicicola]